MSIRAMMIGGAGASPPGAPTNVVGTAASTTSISVAFDAPADNGGSAITGYTVTSSPGGLTGTGSSSPITVSGLTQGQSYTFTVTATNAIGTGLASSASASVATTAPPGEEVFTTAGSYTWTAPAGVTSVSVLAIGGGGAGVSFNTGGAAGGGGLGWKNNIPVTPGSGYTVVVGLGGGLASGAWGAGQPNEGQQTGQSGGTSYFSSTGLVAGFGGKKGEWPQTGDSIGYNSPHGYGGPGGTYSGDGGGNGGQGGTDLANNCAPGGGAAGGYAGSGGNGGGNPSGSGTSATSGGGGGGGGGGASNVPTASGGGGGGVGLYGQGPSGTRGTDFYMDGSTTGGAGNGGSGGSSGGNGYHSGPAHGTNYKSGSHSYGGAYGGGGSGSNDQGQAGYGGVGAVRIIHGAGRSFPSNAG